MELIKDKFIYSQMPIYSFDIAKYILSIFVITIHSFGFIENNIENELARRFIYTLINKYCSTCVFSDVRLFVFL